MEGLCATGLQTNHCIVRVLVSLAKPIVSPVAVLSPTVPLQKFPGFLKQKKMNANRAIEVLSPVAYIATLRATTCYGSGKLHVHTCRKMLVSRTNLKLVKTILLKKQRYT